MAERGAVREILPGAIYQRGHMLGWQPKQKVELLAENNITIVVNLWPKIDTDWSWIVPSMYLHIPIPRTERIFVEPFIAGARMAADLVEQGEVALVLCEAGRTRSSVFAGLMLHHLLRIGGEDVLEKLKTTIPGLDLKPHMITYLKGLK